MKLYDFFPHLLVELPGVSDPMLNQVLLRTAIEFCQRAQVWHDISDPVALREGLSDYDLDTPTDAKVFLLREAWVGRHQLHPVTLQRLQVELPSDLTTGSSEPTHFRMSVDRQSITVYPVPRNVVGSAPLLTKLVFVPKPTATTLPDLLGDRFLNAVCAGVKANLMAMPGMTWSNPALSAFYRTQFDDGVLAAKLEAVYDTSIGGQSVVASRLFGF